MTLFRLRIAVLTAFVGIGSVAVVSPPALGDELPTITTTLTASQNPAPYGRQPTVTATITPAPETGGTVIFEVDSLSVGNPVPVVDGSATTGPLLDSTGGPLTLGDHEVFATFIPAGAAPGDPLPDGAWLILKVAPARSKTSVVATPEQVEVAVAPRAASAPGTLTPTGTVRVLLDDVEVDTADLADGAAVIPFASQSDAPQKFVVEYSGDDHFLPSRGVYKRTPPTISTTIVSGIKPTRFGWYRDAVGVEFTCTEQSAPLVGTCPDPVTLDIDGADQLVSGSIAAADGGWAETEVSVSIDRVMPKLRLRGIRDGAVYHGHAPRARCIGKDTLSGIASCRIIKHRKGEHVRFRAVARDKAGNSSVIAGSYEVRRR